MKDETTQDRLRLCEERTRVLSELTSDFVYAFRVKDGLLSLDWGTAAFFRNTGYVLEELDLSRGWLAIVHSEDKPIVQAHYSRLLAGEASASEFRIQTKSGGIRWIKDYARPVREPRGAVTQIVGASQDYTFVRQAQDQELALAREQTGRQQAEALAEVLRDNEARSRRQADNWQQFVRRVSDELRETVNSLSASASLLQIDNGEELNDRGREHVRRLTDAIGRMHGLLHEWPQSSSGIAEDRGRR